MPFCPACGKENAAGVTFCANCGKPLTAATAAQPMAGAMPGAVSTAPGGLRYAEIVDRFIGALIDFIILAVITFVISFAGIFGGLGFLLFLVLPWVLGLAYFTYFEGTTGQTLGKQVAHTKVVDVRTGQTVDMGRAFIRTLLRIIDQLPFLYVVGLILVAVTPNKQRLGDMAANTIVVKV